MKHRSILIFIIICVLISAGILIADTVRSINIRPNLVDINNIKITSESAEDISKVDINSQYDFTIISVLEENYGEILYTTKQTEELSAAERLNRANSNYDTVLDFEQNGDITGKIIVYTSEEFIKNQELRLVAIIVPFSILCILLILYYLYMRYYLYRPFKRLKKFAKDIAIGNFDESLPMDKDNLFGEFTESFDIMREELKIAKEKALAEEISKKELIAALSHDIKTPISIIRAASELLEIGETNEKKMTNIKIINAKTFEVDSLVTDLLTSSLEDLSELKIDVEDIASNELRHMISLTDSLKKVIFKNEVTDCLIRADRLRVSQIFGNIISNSYKYAGTKIEVSFDIVDKFLKISFKDFGSTLTKEEVPLIGNKFYRGNNANGKQGAGLGLYICSSLMQKMDGKLEMNLEKDGLRIDVIFKLS